jgi:hypothetical protein
MYLVERKRVEYTNGNGSKSFFAATFASKSGNIVSGAFLQSR